LFCKSSLRIIWEERAALKRVFRCVMSKRVIIAIVSLLILALTGSIVCSKASKPAYAASSTLTILSGEEVFLSEQGGDWNKVSEEMVIVEEGDGVRTGDDSFALITFHDGSTIEIEPNTEISITEMTDTSTSVWQEVGRTWSGVKKLADTNFEVETPSAAAVARGTLIDTTVDELGNTLWAVFEGELQVTAQKVSRTVGAGMQVSIEKNKIPGEPEPIPLPRNRLKFTMKSPAWLLVVASPEERSVGVVPPGIIVTQLPRATTTGAQSDPQVVVIPVPEEVGTRTYYVVLYGKEEGTALVEIDGYAEDQSAFHISRQQEVSPFETEGIKYVATLTVTVGEDGLIIGAELGPFQATTEEGPGKVALLMLSGISTQSITETSAVITWTTNQPATSQVEYGLTTSYGSTTTLDEDLVTSHSVSLSDLDAGTTYHYRVKSKYASENERTSGDHTFVTASPGAHTLPGTYSFRLHFSYTSGTEVSMFVRMKEGVGYRVDYTVITPEEMTIIFIYDGEYEWIYYPDFNMAYKYRPDSGMNPGQSYAGWFSESYYGSRSEGDILESMEAGCATAPNCADVAITGHEDVGGEDCTVFTWTYTDGSTYRYWIPTSNGCLAKFESYNADTGVTTTAQFTDIDLNPTISDAIFDVHQVFIPWPTINDMTGS
jgi:outer membrane lipoprotein-sorting protein